MNEYPCCENFTIKGEGDYDIFKVCFWEDDPISLIYSEEALGANTVSLNKAKKIISNLVQMKNNFLVV